MNRRLDVSIIADPTRGALGAVAEERRRQEAKCAAKRAEGFEHWRTPADPLCPDDIRFPILAEELGEVAKELNDARGENRPPGPNLRVELIHVAAVAVAWIEWLDAQPMEGRQAA